MPYYNSMGEHFEWFTNTLITIMLKFMYVVFIAFKGNTKLRTSDTWENDFYSFLKQLIKIISPPMRVLKMCLYFKEVTLIQYEISAQPGIYDHLVQLLCFWLCILIFMIHLLHEYLMSVNYLWCEALCQALEMHLQMNPDPYS